MSVTAPQCGHFPRLPAWEAGTARARRHPEQASSMVRCAVLSEGAGTDSTCGTSDVGGILTLIPHSGHFPLRPAVRSGERIRLPQPGQ